MQSLSFWTQGRCFCNRLNGDMQKIADEPHHAFDGVTTDFCREDAQSVEDDADSIANMGIVLDEKSQIFAGISDCIPKPVGAFYIKHELSTDGNSAHAGEAACNVAVDIPLLPPPNVSKADEDFLRDGIEFVWGIDGIDIEELNTLFSKVHLWPQTKYICQWCFPTHNVVPMFSIS